MNGDFRKVAKERTLCRSYMPLEDVVNRDIDSHTGKSFFAKPTSSEGLYNPP